MKSTVQDQYKYHGSRQDSRPKNTSFYPQHQVLPQNQDIICRCQENTAVKTCITTKGV